MMKLKPKPTQKLTPAQLEVLDVTGFWLEPREPAVAEMEAALVGNVLTLPDDAQARYCWYAAIRDEANAADDRCLDPKERKAGMARFHAHDRRCLTNLANKLLLAWLELEDGSAR